MAGNFDLTFFSPIGFISPKYLNNYCLFCKGQLANRCVKCSENSITEKCDVNEKEDMHIHCQKILEKKTTED
uniref:Uncharacterized protein n=1 Tax=viral metagenome TaxID=1070528 RepID=A0A6C0CAW9_9ZZZZ